MSASRRGYLSFLLFIPLALLLLLPLLLRPSPPSPAPLYADLRTASEQAAFSRALLVSVQGTAAGLPARAFLPAYVFHAGTVLGCPTPTAEAALADPLTADTPLPFPTLTFSEQACLARFEVLNAWSGLLSDWSRHSDYSAHLSCSPLPGLPATELGPAPLVLSPDWVACASELDWQRDTRRLALRPGLMARVSHSDFGGLQAQSELPALEVGG